MIKVAVYDDNKERRDSLAVLLSFLDGMTFVGGYENTATIEDDVIQAAPDVILMDIEMPGGDGIRGVRIIKPLFPDIKIIMQTAFDDDEKVFAALQAGAEGYILKTASITQITQSIDEVINGGASMSPSIALKVMRYFNTQSQPANYGLTAKETEVLKHLSTGLSYKMIADQLGISYFTVNNHVKKIYEKLQVHSLGEAVAMAHKNRLV